MTLISVINLTHIPVVLCSEDVLCSSVSAVVSLLAKQATT